MDLPQLDLGNQNGGPGTPGDPGIILGDLGEGLEGLFSLSQWTDLDECP